MKNEKSVRSRFLFLLFHWRLVLITCSSVTAAWVLLCMQQGTQRSWASPLNGRSSYFNTAFLSNTVLVRKQLLQDGFVEQWVKTNDGILLNCLYLERPRATCTVIACAGWFPGKKEGLATFYELLPTTCNILLFDARGHGLSTGSFLWSLCTYGQHEYKDILAAIEHVHQCAHKPIILLGICAGAFHAVHALAHLEQIQKTTQYAVAGLVFDSGWGSLKNTSQTVPHAKIKELITGISIRLVGKKYGNNIFARGAIATGCFISDLVRHIFYLPLSNSSKAEIFDAIQHIGVPIFFIHAQNDEYVAIDHVRHLSSISQHSSCWWIEKPSKHACHHLKFKDEYRKKLRAFIAEIVPEKR